MLNVFVGVFAWFGVCLFLSLNDIGNTLDGWLSAVAGWTAVWAGVMFVHFFVIERKRDDFTSVLGKTGSDGIPVIRWQSLAAFFAGLFTNWMFAYGSLLQGPAAAAMGGVDLSWLFGILTSAGVYDLLAKGTGLAKENALTPATV